MYSKEQNLTSNCMQHIWRQFFILLLQYCLIWLSKCLCKIQIDKMIGNNLILFLQTLVRKAVDIQTYHTCVWWLIQSIMVFVSGVQYKLYVFQSMTNISHQLGSLSLGHTDLSGHLYINRYNVRKTSEDKSSQIYIKWSNNEIFPVIVIFVIPFLII